MARDARLKSLFLLPAVAVSALFALTSLGMVAVADGQRLAWLGAALASLALPLVPARLVLRPVARTAEYLPMHLLVAVVGLVLAGRGMYSNFVTSWELYNDFPAAVVSAFVPTADNVPGLIAILATVLLALYVFWYSRFGRHPDARLDVGSKLPDFVVKELDGTAVRSADLLGAPTVFLFYRGNWCPLCMAQIGELVERYGELEKLGITVCLISPQPADRTRELAERHGVRFRYFLDEDNRAARELGIAVDNGVPLGVPGHYPSATVMPTMFVTTAGGTIVFSDQTDNYRVRPEPDIFLAILRRSGAVTA
ncbi:MAG: peroxiredoxin family protein [Woeseiaceae bacterium]|nr:peroxiredoxin family protein [Woeseiaceae bacterium]